MAVLERTRQTTKKEIGEVAHFVTCDEEVVAKVGWRGVQGILASKTIFFWQVHLKKMVGNPRPVIGNMLAFSTR